VTRVKYVLLRYIMCVCVCVCVSHGTRTAASGVKVLCLGLTLTVRKYFCPLENVDHVVFQETCEYVESVCVCVCVCVCVARCSLSRMNESITHSVGASTSG